MKEIVFDMLIDSQLLEGEGGGGGGDGVYERAHTCAMVTVVEEGESLHKIVQDLQQHKIVCLLSSMEMEGEKKDKEGAEKQREDVEVQGQVEVVAVALGAPALRRL